MAEDDIFSGSTGALSFEKFISTINQERARDLVKHINIFMKTFRSKAPNSTTDSKDVQDFMFFMERAFAGHPLWAGCSRDDLDAAVEGLEKYLLTKLYDRTFAMDMTDRERDAVLNTRLAALQFVLPEHLEINTDFAVDGTLALAQKELKKMNMFKSPREKLVCMLNCCRIINNLLASRRYGAGADDFTPVLIYVIIKAQPEYLASNLAFIERYRTSSKLVSEAQYFFVQMQGAAAFIETLTTSSLKVDPDLLLAHMLAEGAITDAEMEMMSKATSRGSGDDYSQSSSAEIHNNLAVGQGGAYHYQQGASIVLPPPPPPPPPSDRLSGTHNYQQTAFVPPPPPPSPPPSHSGLGNLLMDLMDYQEPVVSNPLLAQHNNFQPSPPPPPPTSSSINEYQKLHVHQGSAPHMQVNMMPGHYPYSTYPGMPHAESADMFSQQQHSNSQHGDYNKILKASASSEQAIRLQQVHQGQLQYLANGGPVLVNANSHPVAPSHSAMASPPPPPPPTTFPVHTAEAKCLQQTTSPIPFVSPVSDSANSLSYIPLPPPPPALSSVSLPQGPESVEELMTKGLTLFLQSEAQGETQVRYPYLHTNVEGLTLGDVRELLKHYKELVVKYECTTKALEQQASRYPNELEQYKAAVSLVERKHELYRNQVESLLHQLKQQLEATEVTLRKRETALMQARDESSKYLKQYNALLALLESGGSIDPKPLAQLKEAEDPSQRGVEISPVGCYETDPAAQHFVANPATRLDDAVIALHYGTDPEQHLEANASRPNETGPEQHLEANASKPNNETDPEQHLEANASKPTSNEADPAHHLEASPSQPLVIEADTAQHYTSHPASSPSTQSYGVHSTGGGADEHTNDDADCVSNMTMHPAGGSQGSTIIHDAAGFQGLTIINAAGGTVLASGSCDTTNSSGPEGMTSSTVLGPITSITDLDSSSTVTCHPPAELDRPLEHGYMHDRPLEHGHMHDRPLEHGHMHDRPLEHGHMHDRPLEHGHMHDRPLEHGHMHDATQAALTVESLKISSLESQHSQGISGDQLESSVVADSTTETISAQSILNSVTLTPPSSHNHGVHRHGNSSAGQLAHHLASTQNVEHQHNLSPTGQAQKSQASNESYCIQNFDNNSEAPPPSPMEDESVDSGYVGTSAVAADDDDGIGVEATVHPAVINVRNNDCSYDFSYGKCEQAILHPTMSSQDVDMMNGMSEVEAVVHPPRDTIDNSCMLGVENAVILPATEHGSLFGNLQVHDQHVDACNASHSQEADELSHLSSSSPALYNQAQD